jgi:hypothetical protein
MQQQLRFSYATFLSVIFSLRDGSLSATMRDTISTSYLRYIFFKRGSVCFQVRLGSEGIRTTTLSIVLELVLK